MGYLKALTFVSLVVVGFSSWFNWVSERDEHLFALMDCVTKHRQVSRQEAVLICEREVR